MSETEKSVLIVGGGVAGMSAARSLNTYGITVHLVEKSDKMGGNTIKWSCMSTDACNQCGACLGIELVSQLDRMDHVNQYLNTEISGIFNKDKKLVVKLNDPGKKIFEVDKVILATGFKPVNPEEFLSLRYKDLKNVISTVDLNEILKNEILSEYLKENHSPKIGFIQCVGTRNSNIGRDYCSQICCKVSLRQIKKLAHLYPDAKISLFYIDLQVIGKEARYQLKSLPENVTVIQGVPSEIFNNRKEDKLTIIREGKGNISRMEDHYDMMVLSVGMQPSDNIIKSEDSLNIKTDTWGFLNNQNVIFEKKVYIAGCASGPMDILNSQQKGVNCAGQIIKDFSILDLEKKNASIAIIGDSIEAFLLANTFINNGYDVWLFGSGDKKEIKNNEVTYCYNSRIISVKGTVGHFTILYCTSEIKEKKKFSAIIVAEDLKRESISKLPDLLKKRFYSLENFINLYKENLINIPNRLVLWMDYSGHEWKDSERKALLLAIELVDQNKIVNFIMEKMLVHGLKGQQLYSQARRKGVRFLRVEKSSHVAVKNNSDSIGFSIKDSILEDINILFESDCLIVPDIYKPSEHMAEIAKLLGEKTDREGFIQSANTRHRLNGSLCKGVFFAGSCHDEVDVVDFFQEVSDILFSVNEIIKNRENDILPEVVINEIKCVRCLTCYRICPHSAVVFSEEMKPLIKGDACFACGLCVSSCPALAIEQKTDKNIELTERVSKNITVVFACERSSALAAKEHNLPEHIKVIKVPCISRVDKEMILKYLIKDAKKIILSGCHMENCRSFAGSEHAENCVNQIKDIIEIDNSIILWEPIAANEPVKFKRIINLL